MIDFDLKSAIAWLTFVLTRTYDSGKWKSFPWLIFSALLIAPIRSFASIS